MDYFINALTWERFLKILRTINKLRTKDESRLRRFIEAVWYIARSGCQWRLLPKQYGCWRSVYKRFSRWKERGIWSVLFKGAQDNTDLEAVMLDATITRAHACAAGYRKDNQAEQALGRSKGGFTTKIHASVDGLGNPLEFSLTGGQRHDITQAPLLIEGLKKALILADKAYDSKAFVRQIEAQECIPVIPPRKNCKNPRDYDEHWYKERHAIECFFGKIKHFRRIFSRFDKTASAYLAFLHFVPALIWCR